MTTHGIIQFTEPHRQFTKRHALFTEQHLRPSASSEQALRGTRAAGLLNRMTRVLILGGTGWLGREIAIAARDQGAEVVCLARGDSGSVPAGVRHVVADRRAPDAYHELASDWDEVIEVSYSQDLVAPALAALAHRAARWTLVSSVSVYAQNDTPRADESAAVVDPVDLSRYPDAKVAAEQITAEHVGSRLLIARPGLIAGPGDPSDRLGYWLARLHQGGRVLTPELAERFVQFIDVGDLAQWIVTAGANAHVGTINAVGTVHTMANFFDAAATATGFSGDLVEIPDPDLEAQGVNYWAGPHSLPLWLPVGDRGFAQRDGTAYLAAGGSLTPLSVSLSQILDDELTRGVDRPRRAGLTRPEEAAVLAAMSWR